jgi:hypothetical protein
MKHSISRPASGTFRPWMGFPLLLVLGGVSWAAETDKHWEMVSQAIDEVVEGREEGADTGDDATEYARIYPRPPHILCWDTPITEVSLGEVPDPLVEGHSLQQIVSSQVIVRPDGLGCSACHYQDNGGNPGDHYRPPVAQHSTTTIYPWTEGISKHKPAYLNPDHPTMTWRGEYGYSQTNTWMFLSFTQYFLNLAAFNNKPYSVAVALREWRDDGYCQSAYPVALEEYLMEAQTK